MTARLYHLVPAAEWSANAGDDYRPTSLRTEGFIHFSTAEQIPATSLRYYANVDDLLVVTVDPDAIPDEIRWEDLHGTGRFPHLYAPLPLAAVIDVRGYTAGTELGPSDDLRD